MAIVMFIDDNPETLELMERSISMLGHQAICCSDETSALQVASQNQPDLIFTDLSLQSIDGLTLLRILKQHPETSTIPVIVVSAGSAHEHSLDALAAGADGFLEKPIRFDELRHVFEKFLPNSQT
ncbi:MAG: response regulator [bacterium]